MTKFNLQSNQIYSELSKFEIEEILYNATKQLNGKILKKFHTLDREIFLIT